MGDLVLKFKKPLRFSFVDLRSLDARLRACEAEVESNRRLSPDVYTGVADVRLGERVLDHAVVMRRLPGDRSLSAMLARNDPSLDGRLRQLALALSDFHEGAARSPEIDSAATPDGILELWNGSFEVLAPFREDFEPGSLDRAAELARRFVEGRGPLFAQRISEGRICDGHGDLLADDVFFLDDGPRILDCVEFDPKLRHVDTVADVAFLVMDLERLGAGEHARRFAQHYVDASGDHFPPALLDHYCAQRAVVRAEVACLRSAQGATSELDSARALLDIALEHLQRSRLVLGIVCGLPGTGKSTLAAAIGGQLEWPVLRSDEIRREMVGATPDDTPLRVPFGTGPYASGVTDRTYRTMLSRARVALEHGQSVLLDATFNDARSQHLAESLARESSSDLVAVRCESPRSVSRARIARRRLVGTDVSEADERVADAMAAVTHHWPHAHSVDTAGTPLDASVKRGLALLGQRT